MIVGSSAAGAGWFLDGLAAIQRQETKTQRELSSGYRIQDASDSPAQTPELIDLGSGLTSLQTYQQNLGRVQAETNAADAALSTGIDLIDTARTVAVQGAGTTETAATREALAVQVKSIRQQFVSLANITVEGRYIFGGDQDQAPPYRLNDSAATGVDKLTPQTSTRTIVDPSGEPIFQSTPAASIFDHADAGGAPAADNVFAALQNLGAALQANDPAAVATALTSLESAAAWLNGRQAAYGTSDNRITEEQNNTANAITVLQTRISGIRDTDVAQAATDLAQETTSQSAAVSAQSEVPRKSLFDYLG